jgi:hypothetical protein
MRWLKIMLLVTGVAYLIYAFLNYFVPTGFLAPSDAAAGWGLDAVKLIGAGYLPLAIVLIGSWWVTDRFSIRLVAYAAIVYAAAFAANALMAKTGSSDPFHTYGMGIAAAWAVVTVLYGWLIYRERSEAA